MPGKTFSIPTVAGKARECERNVRHLRNLLSCPRRWHAQTPKPGQFGRRRRSAWAFDQCLAFRLTVQARQHRGSSSQCSGIRLRLLRACLTDQFRLTVSESSEKAAVH